MHFSGRKIFLFGFIAVLLLAIPGTLYLVGLQNKPTKAEKSTNITFTPDSSASAPVQKSVGDSIPLDIFVDPGQNLVGFVKLEIQYDPQKLATASADAFTPNSQVFPTVLEGPDYSTPGKITVSLSVGPDPTKSLQTKAKAATVTFKALANTAAGTPTEITYGTSTQALSVGASDQASENVLSSATPAFIAIAGSAITPTPTTIPVTPTATPEVTVTPTTEPTTTPSTTVTPATTVAPTTSTNQVPVCSSLDADKTPTGAAPLDLTFTANGTDTDGTISKVTFNFGDGQVSDVTTGGGIGTATANTSVAHTYSTAGTFTASAIFTDNGSGVSDSTSCKQTVTVTGSGSSTTVAPTIAATGTTGTAIGLGVIIMTFILGGGFLFFLL